MPCYNCTQKIPGILFIGKVDEIFAVDLNTSLKVVNKSSFQQCNYFINFKFKIISVFFYI